MVLTVNQFQVSDLIETCSLHVNTTHIQPFYNQRVYIVMFTCRGYERYKIMQGHTREMNNI